MQSNPVHVFSKYSHDQSNIWQSTAKLKVSIMFKIKEERNSWHPFKLAVSIKLKPAILWEKWRPFAVYFGEGEPFLFIWVCSTLTLCSFEAFKCLSCSVFGTVIAQHIKIFL